MRPIIAFGLIALVLHWSWETGHAVAYVETDVPFSQRVGHCFPMAILDTAWSGAVALLSLAIATVLRRPSVIWTTVPVVGTLTAVALERFALETGRWTYNDLMPIVPVVSVGFWPVAQMIVVPLLACVVATRLGGKA